MKTFYEYLTVAFAVIGMLLLTFPIYLVLFVLSLIELPFYAFTGNIPITKYRHKVEGRISEMLGMEE